MNAIELTNALNELKSKDIQCLNDENLRDFKLALVNALTCVKSIDNARTHHRHHHPSREK